MFEIDHKLGIVTVSLSKQMVVCDSCRASIDMKKPKKGEPPSDAISATLNAGLDTTKSYEFCNEQCLLDFLKKRNKK